MDENGGLLIPVSRLNRHFPHWSELPARIPNQPSVPGATSIVNEERKRRAILFEPTRSIVDKRSGAIKSGRQFAPVHFERMRRMIRVMKNCCPLSNWHLVNFIRFGLTRNSVAFRTGEV